MRTRYLPVAALAGLAVGLLVLAAPRIAAIAPAFAPHALAYRLYRDAEQPTLPQLALSRFDLDRAEERVPGNPWVYFDRAVLRLAGAPLLLAEGQAGDYLGVFDAAAADLRAALKRSPANADWWYMLSYSNARAHGIDTLTEGAIEASQLTGPREAWIATRRLGFLLRHWSALTDPLRAAALSDIDVLLSRFHLHKVLAWVWSTVPPEGQDVIERRVAEFGGIDWERIKKVGLGYDASESSPLSVYPE